MTSVAPPATHTRLRRTPVGDFFRYHGWLSPGVRWFRQTSFSGKASAIAIAFVLPLVVLLAFLWSEASGNIASTQAERDGVAYARPLLKLIRAGQNRRTAATLGTAEVGTWQQQTEDAFKELEAREQTFGPAFHTKEAFDELKKRHEVLLKTSVLPSASGTFQIHADYLAAALKLLTTMVDSSGLSLDPALDTFHMMNVALLRGPMQTENTAKIATFGALILKSQDLNPLRHDALVQWAAVQRFLDSDVEASYQAGVGETPEKAKRYDMEGTDAAFDTFMEAVKTRVLGGELQGPAESYLALGEKVQSKQNELNGEILKHLDIALQARIDAWRHTFTWQLTLSLTFVAIAGYLMLAFYKVMMGGLEEVASHLREIAQGNLGTAPQPWGSDEAAELMTEMREMQISLRRIVGEVLNGAASVHNASGEIAAASADLSQRTEEAAANLQQTAASMAQISAAAEHTTDQINSASGSVRENAVAAARGGEVIAQVVQTMDQIRGSSNKIGEIIGVIDGIAFQTNILALNAAVEAARAGEHGRGFAVVASEVRALAGRSATAAKEIKSLIGASIEQVNSGTGVVSDAGQIMQTIVGNADKVAKLIAHIAESAMQQSRSVNEVGLAVRSLDETTQQNAALVEQTSAAASALADQADNLSNEVSFFTLTETTR
jgi:methyl-accepting chemotaxis protein